MNRLNGQPGRQLARRNVLITGASSGLGAELARQHAARGSNLALCARRADRLADLRAELLGRHPSLQVEVRQLDVIDHSQVFAVFEDFAAALGGLDRVIVNAGVSRGAVVGTGGFDINQRVLATNLDAALAQCEAAVEGFRARQAGHLVVVSSMSALRGLPGMTAYSASKAGVATLAEGIRASLLGTPIKVTTLFPGFIQSEMSTRGKRPPLMVPTDKGVRAMMKAIEAERPTAIVPAWPWVPIAFVLRRAPLPLIARVG